MKYSHFRTFHHFPDSNVIPHSFAWRWSMEVRCADECSPCAQHMRYFVTVEALLKLVESKSDPANTTYFLAGEDFPCAHTRHACEAGDQQNTRRWGRRGEEQKTVHQAHIRRCNFDGYAICVCTLLYQYLSEANVFFRRALLFPRSDANGSRHSDTSPHVNKYRNDRSIIRFMSRRG